MNFKNIITALALALAAQLSQAQMNLPITVIGGHQFYTYETSANESIYDIAAKLGVTKDFIIQNNPSAADGIETGMKLYFPLDGQTNTPVATSVPDATGTHKVEQGETLYGLAKKYGVTIERL